VNGIFGMSDRQLQRALYEAIRLGAASTADRVLREIAHRAVRVAA
jgi:hypothetical protein